jgi:hypothetical protein
MGFDPDQALERGVVDVEPAFEAGRRNEDVGPDVGGVEELEAARRESGVYR